MQGKVDGKDLGLEGGELRFWEGLEGDGAADEGLEVLALGWWGCGGTYLEEGGAEEGAVGEEVVGRGGSESAEERHCCVGDRVVSVWWDEVG